MPPGIATDRDPRKNPDASGNRDSLSVSANASVLAGQEEGALDALLLGDIPHKLDQNFWKNREQLEEIIFLCEEKNWPSAVSSLLPLGPQVCTEVRRNSLRSPTWLHRSAKEQFGFAYASAQKYKGAVCVYQCVCPKAQRNSLCLSTCLPKGTKEQLVFASVSPMASMPTPAQASLFCLCRIRSLVGLPSCHPAAPGCRGFLPDPSTRGHGGGHQEVGRRNSASPGLHQWIPEGYKRQDHQHG